MQRCIFHRSAKKNQQNKLKFNQIIFFSKLHSRLSLELRFLKISTLKRFSASVTNNPKYFFFSSPEMIWTLKIKIWKRKAGTGCKNEQNGRQNLWSLEEGTSKEAKKQESKQTDQTSSEKWKTVSFSIIFIAYFVQTQCSWCILRIATEFWFWKSLQLKEKS